MKISWEDFNKICRICMSKSRHLISVFSESIDIVNKMLSLVKIEVSVDDELPSQICLDCLKNLNFAFDFQSLCRNSDEILRAIVLNHQSNAVNENQQCEDVSIKEEAEQDEENLEEFVAEDIGNRKLSLRSRVKRKYTRVKPLLRYECQPCGKSFKCKQALDYHNLKIHSIAKQKKKSTCLVCQEKFDSWRELAKHERELKHYGKVSCHVCQKQCSRSYLSEHLQMHVGLNAYLCNLCGKSFKFSSSFKKHSEVCGLTEKQIKCNLCDHRFYTLKHLRQHERSHTKDKPFVCETCGKGFRTKDKLAIHQMTHSNLRPHHCDICGRNFRQRIHLKEHCRIHTGIKPFVCEQCGAGFTQGHCLKTHKLKACTKQEELQVF